ncbi:MAG: CPBP family glutamic-type intramembrane protease, partial [Deltaproteobacteria bacterium]|nr:CPBP family glutamic-type intramembrane protease [Deltaproteobacteria bacterium]
RRALAALAAVILSALLFSWVHYIGPFGDPLELSSFMFRFIAGLLFSGLYYWRGFAVTAYTHALYDIRVILF